MKRLITYLVGILNTGVNTEKFQEYLEQKTNRTKEEELALVESKIMYTKVLSATTSVISLILSFGIGYAIARYCFDCEKVTCFLVGVLTSFGLGCSFIVLVTHLISYPKKHWNIYILKVSEIVEEYSKKDLGLSDEGFFEEFIRVKHILSEQGKDIDQLIEEYTMEPYSKLVKKSIIIMLVVVFLMLAMYVLRIVVSIPKKIEDNPITFHMIEQYDGDEFETIE